MYLRDPDCDMIMPSVISDYASKISYVYNDDDHDIISFTCACGLIYTIFCLTNGLELGQADGPPVMGPDLAHNRASQPQYC